jgi:membrane protease YdiL (CAAX protease family)
MGQDSAQIGSGRLFTWLALLVAMLFPSLLTWVYFVALAGGQGPSLAQQTAYALGKVAQFAWPVLCVWYLERRFPWPAPVRARGLLLGLGIGLLVAGVMLWLYYGMLHDSSLLHRASDRLHQKLAEFGLTSRGRFILFAVFLCGLHSLLEEYYWRWFVFGRLRRLIPFTPALLLSSLAFMAHHVIVLSVYLPDRFYSAALPLSLGVAGGGAIWAWLYDYTGSIYPSWIGHLFADAAIFLVGYDLLFR